MILCDFIEHVKKPRSGLVQLSLRLKYKITVLMHVSDTM